MTYIRPQHARDKMLDCFILQYNQLSYLLDEDDYFRIVNHNKHFLFHGDMDNYPSYIYNGRAINFLEFLYCDNDYNNYVFKNGNKYDLRRKNIHIKHPLHDTICRDYNVIEYIPGHYPHYKHHNIMKNPMWKINQNGKVRILMFCEVDSFCILCPESYQKIVEFEQKECQGKKLTFTKMTNGYISSHISANKTLFIHQIITGYFGNGRGTKNISIDHIDRNPLNNAMDNLRLATREEQEQNTTGIAPNTKKARHHNARPLPEGITQDMMRKYVVFYSRLHNKETGMRREYFVVETHPLLNGKRWESTKSAKVSMLDKLAQANKTVEDLDKGILPGKKERGGKRTANTITETKENEKTPTDTENNNNDTDPEEEEEEEEQAPQSEMVAYCS